MANAAATDGPSVDAVDDDAMMDGANITGAADMLDNVHAPTLVQLPFHTPEEVKMWLEIELGNMDNLPKVYYVVTKGIQPGIFMRW